jgi:hypothetical protein
MLTINQPPGQYTLQVVIPSLAIGSEDIVITAGQTTEVTIILNDNIEVIEPSTLVLDELVNGGLSFDTPTITLRFVKDGATVPISYLEEVELTLTNPDFEPQYLTDFFEVNPDGTISAMYPYSVIAWIQGMRNNARLRVNAIDARGFSYEETVTFSPGIYQVNGRLVAPPSQPLLPIANLVINVEYGIGINATVSTDDLGVFTISQVPGGMVHLSVITEYEGFTYTGWADIAVDENKALLVNMLGITDILNGVPAWEETTNQQIESKYISKARLFVMGIPKFLHNIFVAATDQAQVSVVAGSEGFPVTDSAVMTVAKGTKKVFLKYQVSTDEYPYWVLQQSIYNDTWRLAVMNNTGGQLFSIARSVNSQLYSPPTWNFGGSTGELQQEIDVSSLTANNDIQLTLVASATNIGDDLLPTCVTATLSTEATLSIDKITADIVNPTTGQSDRYSIPRPGQTNTFQRHFDLTFTKADDITITNVKAELLTSTGAVLQTVVDEAPGSTRVRLLNDTTLRVEVTFSSSSSQIASTPPPSDQIYYSFTLKGSKSNGQEVESEVKNSATYYALWRMPDGLPRYGMRDPGLDDWVSLNTYNWLVTNQNLVTRIDDISGEHARNIGHQGHAEGREIDMFHVYTFPNGGGSGGQNYLRLRENVQAALNNNAQAIALVTAWATATRNRFDQLLANNNVQRIYYAIGDAVQGAGQTRLTNGWARELLVNGTYTNPDGLVINLNIGVWGNANNQMMGYNSVHNSHFHVTLRH